jgi:glycosyltransferase involved in cell wall biosynthesis
MAESRRCGTGSGDAARQLDAGAAVPRPRAGTCYSLIIPVYKNEETLGALIQALDRLSAELDHKLEVVFVVDGSPDRSFAILREALARGGLPAQLICLSRNFGSFAAIRMGLESARGPFYAVLAADLQEPPELIVAFFHALEGGDVDVVVGVRESREDPFLSALSSRIFWAAYRRFVQPEVPPGGVDVFGCSRIVRDALLRMRESNSTLIGLLFWLGFRRRNIPYIRRSRVAGKSAWSFRRKLRYLLDSCFALTDLPINLIMITGVLGLATSLILSVLVFIAWLAGMIPVPGYTPLALLMLNSFTATTLALGVIGSYVWRTYENTKNRPLYVPMIHEVFEEEPPP